MRTIEDHRRLGKFTICCTSYVITLFDEIVLGTDSRILSLHRLKTSLPRNSTTKHLEEESFEERRSLHSSLNASPDEMMNNTVTELRPYAAVNSPKQMHTETNNSVDTSVKNSSTADKSCADAVTQNTGTSVKHLKYSYQ